MDRNSGKTVIIPMDHGITVGPIAGLQDMRATVGKVAEGGANAIILHKGIVTAGHRGAGTDVGLIVHLSGSTSLGPDPNAKVPVCGVEEAIKLGADAVSVHINVGADTEPDMLRHLGDVAGKCAEWCMPLVAMMYTRGAKIKNQFDVKYVKHAARVGAELGADIIKVNYTGSAETFSEVVNGCPVPVVIAGGEKSDTEEGFLSMVGGALKAGGAGVSIGRNAFQHHAPEIMVRAIANMVHKEHSVDQSIELLKGKA
jgi:predicted phospho-2-dehydro-3-deoxyheptonate aldolase